MLLSIVTLPVTRWRPSAATTGALLTTIGMSFVCYSHAIRSTNWHGWISMSDCLELLLARRKISRLPAFYIWWIKTTSLCPLLCLQFLLPLALKICLINLYYITCMYLNTNIIWRFLNKGLKFKFIPHFDLEVITSSSYLFIWILCLS